MRGHEGEETDAWLAQRVQRGDRDAFEALARRYLRPVWAVAGSFLREPADVEDAAQETFLRALDRIRTYDPSRPFAPWLYAIARNTARNRRKASSRHRRDPVDVLDLPAADPDPARTAEQRDVRRLVESALEALPEQQRTAFRLFDIEAYSAPEVAALMGIAPGTVRAHVHHARHALRERLGPLIGPGERA